MPCQLSVNVNAIAFLRNRRDLPWPSVEGLSRVALDAGAHGITVHPRPDERHIRRMDVTVLNTMLRADYPKAEFNIEGFPDERFLALCEIEKPDQVTLVPDDPSQPTSDHGWDFVKDGEMLKSVIAHLHGGGMRVSLFVDPDPMAPPMAKAVGADRVEIYTGPYGDALEADAMKREFAKVVACGKAADDAREHAWRAPDAADGCARRDVRRIVRFPFQPPGMQSCRIGWKHERFSTQISSQHILNSSA